MKFTKRYLRINQKVLQRFFKSQERILDNTDLILGSREEFSTELLELNGKVMEEYFDAQEAALKWDSVSQAKVNIEEKESCDLSTLSSRDCKPLFEEIPPLNEAGDQPVSTDSQLVEFIIDQLCELTGYSRDSIEPLSSFNRDLGIDSLTQLSIFGALEKIYPSVHELQSEFLRCDNIAEILNVFNLATGLDSNQNRPTEVTQSSDNILFNRTDNLEAPVIKRLDMVPLGASSDLGQSDRILDQGPVFIISVGRGGLAELVAHELEKRNIIADVAVQIDGQFNVGKGYELGVKTNFPSESYKGNFSVLIICEEEEVGIKSGEQICEINNFLFGLFKALSIPPATFSVVTHSSLGSKSAVGTPFFAGAKGFTRAMRSEWLETSFKQIDLDSGESLDVMLPLVMDQLQVTGEAEVLINGNVCLRPVLNTLELSAISTNEQSFSPEIVLITGGGSGIGAQVAYRLAKERKSHFILVGRTSLSRAESECEYEEVSDLEKLEANLSALPENKELSSKAIRIKARKLVKQSEIRTVMDKLKSLGSTVEYHSIDLCISSDVKSLLTLIQNKGKCIDLLIHSAGLIEPSTLVNKEFESFNRVFRAKALTTLNLYEAAKGVDIGSVVLFSSITAHTGVEGQCDYIVASNVVDSLSVEWNKEVSYPVFSIRWGSWGEHGMVPSSLKNRYFETGVKMLRTEDCCNLIIDLFKRMENVDSPILISTPSLLLDLTKDVDQIVVDKRLYSQK